jgi:FkbM family methyltransferase
VSEPSKIFNIDLPGVSDGPVKIVLDYSKTSQKYIGSHLEKGIAYEGALFALILRKLKRGDTFIDAGAHVGFFSMIAAKLVGEDGEVYSFEMNPDNYSMLVMNAGLNNFRNIRPHNWAISSDSGPVQFWLNQDNDGGHSLWDCGKHSFNEKSRLSPQKVVSYSIALDHYDSFGKVDFIKMDIEGSEVLGLNGMIDLLKKNMPIVALEINNFGLAQMGHSYRDVRDVMGKIGYRCWLIEGQEPKELPMDEEPKFENVYNLCFSTESIL